MNTIKSTPSAIDIYSSARAHPREAAGLQPSSPNPPKVIFKRHRFCRHNIQSCMSFTLQLKSATEIG
jgi:hypothetical protein